MSAKVTLEQIETLRRIDTPTICNAIEQLGIRPPTEGYMGSEVRCLLPHLGIMVGFAVTAQFGTTDPTTKHNMNAYWQMYEALEASPKPAVIVAQEVGPRPGHGCVFGDGMALVANRLGAVGVVTNSAIRDLAGIRSVGLQIFGLGTVAAHGNFGVLEANITVTVSGVLVEPGNLIHGDENGVVVFPAEVVTDVIRKAQGIHTFESNAFAFFSRKDFSLKKLKAWQANLSNG